MADDEQPDIFGIELDSPETSAIDIEEFERACLEEHNNVRRAHGSPPLTISRDLCKFATEWAENLIAKGVMEHRPNNKYGENIYAARGKRVEGALPVRSWYNEIKRYNFQEGKFKSGTGHFTQVIWKGSKELGIGVGKKGDSTFVVCNYNPPGNVQGQFVENVLPYQKIDTEDTPPPPVPPPPPAPPKPKTQEAAPASAPAAAPPPPAQPAPLSAPQSWALVPYHKKEALLRSKQLAEQEANRNRETIALGWAAEETKRQLSSSSSSSSSSSDMEDPVAGCCTLS